MAKTSESKSKSLKQHDFIEIEYTGRLQDGTVFDTTDKKKAKEAGITREGAQFGPVVICLGEGQILEGLEDKIMKSKPGEQITVELPPEKAFGKKSAKKLQLIPRKFFNKEQINPVPGLEVTIDNQYGVVRSVSGGRVIVDFNHPLSGRDVVYDISINKKITDTLEKARSVFANELNAPNVELELKEKTLTIKEDLPEQLLEAVSKRIQDLVPAIKDVKTKTSEKKPSDKK